MNWYRVCFVDPFALPLDYAAGWYCPGAVASAGFNPRDLSLRCMRLAAEWRGRPAGSRVIAAPVGKGYGFAVETLNCKSCDAPASCEVSRMCERCLCERTVRIRGNRVEPLWAVRRHR